MSSQIRRSLHHYGAHRSQIAELWRPPGRGTPPVVVLVHGGFWRVRYTKRLMNGLAAGIARLGVAAWNIEYRRVGPTGGGGYPGTFLDVAAAIDHLVGMPGLDLDRVVTCGHSAGGQLALWAAARPRLAVGAPGASPLVVARGAVSLAGVVDLARAAQAGLGRGAVAELLGGDDLAYRLATCSPFEMLPLGVPQVLIHGRGDDVVPVALSEGYAARARATGDDARLVVLERCSHLQVISTRGVAWRALAGALEELLGAS